VNFILEILSPIWSALATTVIGSIGTIIAVVVDVVTGIIETLTGLIDFVVGIFTGDWEKALNGIKMTFEGILDAIAGIFKGVLNIFIDIINGLISGINGAVGLINKIPGVDIPKIKKIPKLAQGTVVPPNKEFLAVLGDNKTEHEIVSPLSTIKQAFPEAMIEMGGA
jgi:phage-related protein